MFYGVELPTVPGLVVEEMQNLVMLQMFKPDKIYVLITSIGAKRKSDKAFIEIYEQQNRQLEKSEGFLNELGSAFSLILIFASVVLILASFLTCQRTRAFVKDKIEA